MVKDRLYYLDWQKREILSWDLKEGRVWDRDDDDGDDDDDDDCPLIMRQKSSKHSMLMAQGRGDIQISK